MKIGIVGISGYGGAELLRLCAAHPAFEIAYASGDSTAGQKLEDRYPALAGTPTLVIGTHFAGATAGRIVRDGDAFRLAV